jgi:hypothetical protein
MAAWTPAEMESGPIIAASLAFIGGVVAVVGLENLVVLGLLAVPLAGAYYAWKASC